MISSSGLVLILLFNIFFILPALTQRRGQQQRAQYCYLPNREIGFCTPLYSCNEAVLITSQNPRYGFALKRACGNVVFNGYPLVCCRQYQRQIITTTPPPLPIPTDFPTFAPQTTTRRSIPGFFTAPPYETTTAPPPPPPPTTISPNTEERGSEQQCFGPDSVPGVCKEITQCSILLKKLQQKGQDPAFVQFLRQSNEYCENKFRYVCCPSTENSENNNNENNNNNGDDNNESSRQIEAVKIPTIEDGCGYTNNTARRIVGGKSVIPGAWPWMALIGYEDPNGIDFKCGGSLITKRHVLTAAHCTYLKTNVRVVRLGEHDLLKDDEHHIDVPVVKTTEHPSYTRTDGYGDIAIVHLARNVRYNDFIRPLCLPISNELRSKSYVDYTPFVAGWGKTQEGGKSSNILQELQIPIFENNVCINSYYKKNAYISKRQFDNSVICAGVLSGGKDTCQGDSGGPLMIPEADENGEFRFYALGVVSYSIGCARPEIPGVYTSVQHYINWIQDVILNSN